MRSWSIFFHPTYEYGVAQFLIQFRKAVSVWQTGSGCEHENDVTLSDFMVTSWKFVSYLDDDVGKVANEYNIMNIAFSHRGAHLLYPST